MRCLLKTSTSLKPYVFLEISSLTSVIGGSMLFILFPWLALDVTGSSAAAGLLVTITAIPGLLLSPVMGSIIDRFGRRNTSMWVEYLSAVSVVILPIVAWFIDINLFILIIS